MSLKITACAILMIFSSVCYSEDKITFSDYLTDAMVYRPAGLFATLGGTTAFIITLPTTAIGSLFPPHDAIASAAKEMIVDQAKFTFTRPFGVLEQ
jgi:hypothetical protein